MAAVGVCAMRASTASRLRRRPVRVGNSGFVAVARRVRSARRGASRRCAVGQRDSALLAAFALAADVRAGVELMSPQSRPVSSESAQPGLDGQGDQCVVAPALPAVPVRGGEQRVDLGGGEERHGGLVEALRRDREHLRDELSVLRVAQRGVAEQ